MSDWLSAEQHADRAHRFYEAGQWERALAEIRIAVGLNPHQSDWIMGMALTLDALGRYEEAASCYETVLRLRGDDPEIMLRQASDLVRCGKAERALDVLERLTDLDPDFEPAYCQRILAYTQLGDHDKAEESFYMARLIVDQCPTCLDHLAESFVMRGMYDRAARCWEQVLELDPHFDQANANIARVHWEKGDLEKARDFYFRQLREDPGDTQTMLELGRLLVELDQPAEASEKFRRALEMDPTSVEAHVHLAQLALIMGHVEEARLRLNTALRLAPQQPGIRLLQARAALQAGDGAEARKHLAAEMRFKERPPGQAVELARLCYELDQPQVAVKMLNRLLEHDGAEQLSDDELAAALHCRGAAYLMLGRADASIVDCRRALRLAPRNITAMLSLVLAYVEQGSFARARCWLHRARELEPDDPQLRNLHLKLVWMSVQQMLRALRRRFARLIGRA